MNAELSVTTPLTFVAAEACGSSGLSGRALAAAMWSRATRFMLIEACAVGVNDVLRVGICPLFDDATPWPARMDALLECAMGNLPGQMWGNTQAMHVVTHEAMVQPMQVALPNVPLKQAMWHSGGAGFVAALGQTAHRLQGGGGRASRLDEPVAAVCAVDSLFDAARLAPLQALGHLSSEQHPEGLIVSEGAAVLAFAGAGAGAGAHTGPAALGTLHGASAVPTGTRPKEALTAAIKAATAGPGAPARVHTVLWDIGPNNAHLHSVAEAMAALSALTQDAQFVRPLQFIGCTGQAFAAIAMVLALEGCRAGTTSGGSTLICSLDDAYACAYLVQAPWHPNILLADAPLHRGLEATP